MGRLKSEVIMELLHRVPLLIPFYPHPLLLHLYIILALTHAKEQI
jgi:hypothetical protein